eukprot:CAMPEP_0115855752 /NCGR_PEP_ID=MMETSP0287-20121206/14703_1 /TAXON_ID=412157 /ORGANISM="Chrysochromulina rotalis, Strain UIO044" /LENGTH=124 /DNA_ID=CAMNT_0003309913 /DNA_START=322 /DNA_END=695 /DNA_ORIENTATION=-
MTPPMDERPRQKGGGSLARAVEVRRSLQILAGEGAPRCAVAARRVERDAALAWAHACTILIAKVARIGDELWREALEKPRLPTVLVAAEAVSGNVKLKDARVLVRLQQFLSLVSSHRRCAHAFP